MGKHAKSKKLSVVFWVLICSAVFISCLLLAISTQIRKQLKESEATPSSQTGSSLNVTDNPLDNLNKQKPVSTTSQAAPSQNSNKSSANNKLYSLGPCTKIPIPRKTVYINVSYLPVGQTSTLNGWDGYINRCGPDSNGKMLPDTTYPPYDNTVYVGTGTTSSTSPTNPQYTYGQALSLAQQNCRAVLGDSGDSSAMQQCINAYLKKYGY